MNENTIFKILPVLKLRGIELGTLDPRAQAPARVPRARTRHADCGRQGACVRSNFHWAALLLLLYSVLYILFYSLLQHNSIVLSIVCSANIL